MSILSEVVALERDVIGVALRGTEKDGSVLAQDIVARYPSEVCALPMHAAILDVISGILSKDKAPTFDIVAIECRERKIKGFTKEYLLEAAEFGYSCREPGPLLDALIARNRAWRAADAFQRAVADIQSGAVEERLEKASRALAEIDNILMDGADIKLHNLGDGNESDLTPGRGIPTPLERLNSRFFIHHNGWPCPGLAIINGYRGGGKTMFGIQAAMTAARAGFPVLFVSLEMTVEQIEMRAMQMMAGYPQPDKFDDGFEAWYDHRHALRQLNLQVAAPPRASINDVERVILGWYRQHRKGLIVLDYVQLVTATDKRADMYQQTVEVADRLGRLARLCEGAAILGLSQVTERDGKVISRGGQEYENWAQFVMVVQPDHLRDDYHGVDIDSESRYVRINVTKQRHGPGSGEWLMCKFDNRNLLLEDAPLSDAEIEWMRQQRGNKR